MNDDIKNGVLAQQPLPKPCSARCEVWSRIVGYYRPLSDWNRGKRHEFSLRKTVRISEEVVKLFPDLPSADKSG